MLLLAAICAHQSLFQLHASLIRRLGERTCVSIGITSSQYRVTHAHLWIKLFAWMELRCMSGGAAREPDSSSCKDVEPWRADWLRTRTHTRRAQCTPGPLERALVTPHKSIQSLKSRREESWRRGPRRSGHGSHFRARLVSARAGRGDDLMSPQRAGVYVTVIDRGGDAPWSWPV